MERSRAASRFRESTQEPAGSSRTVARAVWRGGLSHNATGMAAELGFRFVHSVLWLLIFMAALSGLAAPWLAAPSPAYQLIGESYGWMPEGAAQFLDAQLRYVMDTRAVPMLLGAGAGWLVSGTISFMTVMNVLDRVQGLERHRPLLARIALGFTLSLGLTSLFLAAFVLLVAQQIAGDAIAQALELGAPVDDVLNVLVVVAVLLGLVTAAGIIYRVAAQEESRVRWVTAGALFFVTIWIVSTTLLALYLKHFGAYANTYGLLGLLLVALTWFYVTSLALVLGAELNVALEMNDGQPGQEFHRER